MITENVKPWHRWLSVALCALLICPLLLFSFSPVQASAAGVYPWQTYRRYSLTELLAILGVEDLIQENVRCVFDEEGSFTGLAEEAGWYSIGPFTNETVFSDSSFSGVSLDCVFSDNPVGTFDAVAPIGSTYCSLFMVFLAFGCELSYGPYSGEPQFSLAALSFVSSLDDGQFVYLTLSCHPDDYDIFFVLNSDAFYFLDTYIEDYSVSSFSQDTAVDDTGVLISSTGYMASGLIDLSYEQAGFSLTVTGANFDTGQYPEAKIHTYTSDGNYLASYDIASGDLNGITVELAEDGSVTLTFADPATVPNTMKYLRITGYGSDAEAAVVDYCRFVEPHLIEKVTPIFGFGVSAVGKIGATVINNPLLLCFCLVPLVGLGIGLFKRMKD